MALPTAVPADVSALKDLVGVAGGTVGGTVRVGKQLVDAGQKQLVDELGSQLESRATGVTIPADAGPYERIGALLARAVGTDTRGGAAVDGAATSILAGLTTASLVSTDGTLNRRGDLVLFVTGAGEGDQQQQQGAATIVTQVVQSVDSQTAGVVLAGPVAAALPGGEVKAVRDDVAAAKDVSTVDSLGRTAGQVVSHHGARRPGRRQDRPLRCRGRRRRRDARGQHRRVSSTGPPGPASTERDESASCLRRGFRGRARALVG